jgi:hypothetical protein
MGYYTVHLLYLVNPYVTRIARRFEPCRLGQRKDQLCVHIWCVTCLVYLLHADLLSKNLMYDLDSIIASILRLDALVFYEIH